MTCVRCGRVCEDIPASPTDLCCWCIKEGRTSNLLPFENFYDECMLNKRGRMSNE